MSVSDEVQAGGRPFSLRLTHAERLALEQAAGSTPLGTYIRARLLEGNTAPRRSPRAAPIKDRQSLAKVLAELGASRLASNVNQLARALNTGTLEVSPDTEAALRDACADIALMRFELFKALGLPSGGPGTMPNRMELDG